MEESCGLERLFPGGAIYGCFRSLYERLGIFARMLGISILSYFEFQFFF